MTQDKRAGFKDPTTLTKLTRYSLYAQVLVGIIAIASGFVEYRLLADFASGVYTSEESALRAGESSDALQAIVGAMEVLVFLVSGVLILKWIYRANYNIRQLGAENIKFTPGWSIGWYFIPIAHLFGPYKAMVEIWQASADPLNWKNQPVAPLLRWWWFFWIALSMLINAASKVSERSQEIDDFVAVNLANQISNIFWIILSLIFVAILNRVFAMQMNHASSNNII